MQVNSVALGCPDGPGIPRPVTPLTRAICRTCYASVTCTSWRTHSLTEPDYYCKPRKLNKS